jgi:hypothetical protein
VKRQASDGNKDGQDTKKQKLASSPNNGRFLYFFVKVLKLIYSKI